MENRTYYAAILSLYDKAYNIDEMKMRDYVQFLISKGVKGFFPCGTSGEYVNCTAEENLKVLQIVLEESKGEIPIIPCASTASLHSTAQLICEMEKMGVCQVSVCPPYYTPLRQVDVLDYYLELLKQTNVDIYLYNIPTFTNEISMPVFQRLIEEKRVKGMKDSSGNLKNISRYVSCSSQLRDDFIIMTGTDEIILPALIAGCRGSVSALSGIVTEAHNALYRYMDSDVEYAKQIQSRIIKLAMLCESVVFPAGYKLALAARGFDVEPMVQNVVERKNQKKFEELKISIRECVDQLLELAGEKE